MQEAKDASQKEKEKYISRITDLEQGMAWIPAGMCDTTKN